MTEQHPLPDEAARRLARPLRLTWLGMLAERVTRAFWPALAVLLSALAALMLGLQDTAPLEAVWGVGVIAVLGFGAALYHGVTRFRWPGMAEARDRLDRTLPGRPLTAISDSQAIGAGDAASEEVWQAHVARMTERAKGAQAVSPDLRLSDRDPYALRYVALLAFVMAVMFGSVWRVASVADMAPGGGGAALAAGPAWEGWIEPPAYTGRPSLYLNDITDERLDVAENSRITVRLYGEVGALTVTETVSGRTSDVPPASDPAQSFEVTRGGTLVIDGAGGRSWEIALAEDATPEVSFDGLLDRTASGEMRQPFAARDDYGVVSGQAIIELNLPAVDRRHGLSIAPDPREPVVLDLPMTITGDRRDFVETLIENLSEHPWAGMPVTMQLTANDALEQVGFSETSPILLPGRRFFDPLASAIAEQRRDLLWSRANARRVSQVLRAVSHDPQEVFRSESAYLMLRVALRQLEGAIGDAPLSPGVQEEVAQALWDIALMIEEGDLSDALERLRRAQDRLAEAIENGASDAEIAELMQELREAMQDYMRQLAEQGEGRDGDMAGMEGDRQEITGDQLDEMLNRLQELMEQGRMAEAQQLLEQLRRMMENMQVTQGEQGQGQQSPGQQAMEGLADTLRQQQGLSDEAFRDLQDQFDPGGQRGQQQGDRPGRQPGQGERQGEGQAQNGRGRGEGQDQPDGGDPPGMSLADRQQALREQLERQRQGLPGAGTPEGEAARESLGRAEGAMDGAEEALRQEDFAGALDNQAEAMEALREGMRELGEAMAQQQNDGQQGEAMGQASPRGQRDPLGREAGQSGQIGTDQRLLQGEDVYRRAQELLDEIRRRSGDQARPEEELDYLRRLLERF